MGVEKELQVVNESNQELEYTSRVDSCEQIENIRRNDTHENKHKDKQEVETNMEEPDKCEQIENVQRNNAHENKHNDKQEVETNMEEPDNAPEADENSMGVEKELVVNEKSAEEDILPQKNEGALAENKVDKHEQLQQKRGQRRRASRDEGQPKKKR